MSMPKVDFEKINESLSVLDHSVQEEFTSILDVIVKKNGNLRASKPKVNTDIDGKAAYVWRLAAFSLSTNPQHHCMPVCADFDLPAYDENGKWSSAVARQMAKELDVLEKIIVNSVPRDEWSGVHRWAKALGY